MIDNIWGLNQVNIYNFKQLANISILEFNKNWNTWYTFSFYVIHKVNVDLNHSDWETYMYY